jgi:hypothetical protein
MFSYNDNGSYISITYTNSKGKGWIVGCVFGDKYRSLRVQLFNLFQTVTEDITPEESERIFNELQALLRQHTQRGLTITANGVSAFRGY